MQNKKKINFKKRNRNNNNPQNVNEVEVQAVNDVAETVAPEEEITNTHVDINETDYSQDYYANEPNDYNAEDEEVLTNEIVADLKNRYGKLKLTMLADQPVIWRIIKRSEYALCYDMTEAEQQYLQSLPIERQAEEIINIRNAKVLNHFVLFPSKARVDYMCENYGGFMLTLADIILKGSGFIPQSATQDI